MYGLAFDKWMRLTFLFIHNDLYRYKNLIPNAKCKYNCMIKIAHESFGSIKNVVHVSIWTATTNWCNPKQHHHPTRRLSQPLIIASTETTFPSD